MGAINAVNFIPEIWDAEVQRELHDNLVAKHIVWDKSGSVSKYGDTIHFNGLNKPTVTGSYDGSLTYENLEDSRVSLLIDQRNTYAFVVDDVEEAMSNVGLANSQTSEAAYQLQETCDAYVLGSNIYGDAAHTITDATLDTTTILSVISRASRILSENNVKKGKWIVIPPWVQEKMELAGIVFSINEGINGKGGMAWAKVRDLTVYVTNNQTTTGSGETQKTECMAGGPKSIGFAQKLMKSRALQDKDSFGTYMSGLQVFGAKVIRPKELVRLTLTAAAETAI